jgi:hypothetical protein
MPSRPERLGFASARKVAGFFDLSDRFVREKAATGEWPSYLIGGRRLFDLDELVEKVKSAREQGRR